MQKMTRDLPIRLHRIYLALSVALLIFIIFFPLFSCNSSHPSQSQDAALDKLFIDSAALDIRGRDILLEDGGVTCPSHFTWPAEKKTINITPSTAVKTTIELPNDPFISPADDEHPRWVKFTILLRDPSKVYFQNSNQYLYHYQFATSHLDPFLQKSREAFEKLSLYEKGQEAITGTLLLPPGQATAEYGIQFYRRDPYNPEMVRVLFDLVKSSVTSKTPFTPFYFPSFFQQKTVQQYQHCFAPYGISLSSPLRWNKGDSIYSEGWAFGKLKRFDGADIQKAFLDGDLVPSDILVTDEVPASLPRVQAIITLIPSQALAPEVALAKSMQLPFVYLKNADRLQPLLNKEIVLRARNRFDEHFAKLIDVDGALDAAAKKELNSLAHPAPVMITAKASSGKLSANVAGLSAADIKFYGAEATTMGLLNRALQEFQPTPIAFSFDLWDQFLDQKMQSGLTLRQEIDSRLKGLTYPPNLPQVFNHLATIRNLIISQATWTSAQRSAIATALSAFNAQKLLWLYPSTNARDDATVDLAPLATRIQACLADDLDSDEVGPSRCDSSASHERGLLSGMLQLFAEFYSDAAYLERLRLGIDEKDLGMAAVVTQAPSENALLAVGEVLATSRPSNQMDFTLYTQTGPDNAPPSGLLAQPEIIHGYKYQFTPNPYFYLDQYSNLVPIGTHVLTWKSDYEQIAEKTIKLIEDFRKQSPNLTIFKLALAFAKTASGKILLTHLRQTPYFGNETKVQPFLVNAPGTFCVFQGEGNDEFAVHRLKSLWSLETKNMLLTDSNRKQTIFTEGSLEVVFNGVQKKLSSSVGSWPDAMHLAEDKNLVDRFSLVDDALKTTYSLETVIDPLVPKTETPILTLHDLYLSFSAEYSTPQPYLDWNNQLSTRTTETVFLSRDCEDQTITAKHSLQKRHITGAQGLVVDTSFYWPPTPEGPSAGYTAPLSKWVQTEIVGLTSQKLILKGPFSQTYHPGHHNFDETFIFEPRLDPSMTQEQLDELAQKDIKLLHIYWDPYAQKGTIRVMGLDNTIRVWN